MSDGEYRLFWSLVGVFGGDVACMCINKRTALYE